ncbi:MAG TPA: hypothetical protein VEX69_04710 [Candidatus Limnocylindria bacterium]|nr:hypothetical protein [Candidatus Limnocylindria bacterium]
MSMRRVVPTLFVAAAALLAVVLLCPPAFAQQLAPVPGTKQVLGLEDVKQNAKGTLSVEKGTLEFKYGKKKADLAVTSINDVITGNDSQRAIGGFVGTLTMFAPYGGGRFLSLFRTKIDTLTIQYHDASGGLHGAIFTLPEGKAEDVKKELLAEGAKTTIPIEPAATGQAPASPKKGEQKP